VTIRRDKKHDALVAELVREDNTENPYDTLFRRLAVARDLYEHELNLEATEVEQ
jgi:hypothetical protein